MIEKLIEIAHLASMAIMDVYQRDFRIDIKSDNSPVTEADLLANQIICKKLTEYFPQIPILSEENVAIDYSIRSGWKQFFLIDPIDGTKEFIQKNGQFTVNIALVENGRSVMGVIEAPALGEIYYAEKNKGSFYIKDSKIQKIPLFKTDGSFLKIGTSVSHVNAKTRKYFELLKDNGFQFELFPIGSSLKICRLARGDINFYPRLGPTSEWDTAAAQIILEESGGQMLQAVNGLPLVYNKEDIKNPEFICGVTDLTSFLALLKS